MEPLKTRLTNQLRARGVKNPAGVAEGLLEKRGQMRNGKLTPEGKKREALGRDGRANDRAAKENGGKPSDYKYNPKTNRSTKK
jgi:hypothetical protein